MAVEGSGRQKSVDPEFKELPGRCRDLVVRVIRQDFLDHETPVAVSSVVGVKSRRIVMRAHVQRMLHHRGCALSSTHRSIDPSLDLASCHIPSVGPFTVQRLTLSLRYISRFLM